MKTLAWRSLSSCLIAALSACTGSTVAAPAPSPPAATQSVVAVVTGYYRTIVTRFSIGAFPSRVLMTLYRVRYGPYHAHLRMVRTRHG